MTVSPPRTASRRTGSPSVAAVLAEAAAARATVVLSGHVQPDADALGSTLALAEGLRRRGARVLATFPDPFRSEEHTSELQSRQYLVCRLLLEKKKQLLFSPFTQTH